MGWLSEFVKGEQEKFLSTHHQRDKRLIFFAKKVNVHRYIQRSEPLVGGMALRNRDWIRLSWGAVL